MFNSNNRPLNFRVRQMSENWELPLDGPIHQIYNYFLKTFLSRIQKELKNKPNVFKLNFVFVEYVKKAITRLKNKQSVGWDRVPVAVVKAIKNQIRLPFHCIINISLLQGIFPEKLKLALVRLQFKKKGSSDIGNYCSKENGIFSVRTLDTSTFLNPEDLFHF